MIVNGFVFDPDLFGGADPAFEIIVNAAVYVAAYAAELTAMSVGIVH